MSRTVRITPEADRQARAIDDWWRQHRSGTPNLFVDELEASMTLIGSAPNVGHPYRRSPVEGTRRVLLRRTRHHVYDAPLHDEVIVLAVWHAKRGSGPPLRVG